MRAPWKTGLQVPPRGVLLYEELSFLDCINPLVSAITCCNGIFKWTLLYEELSFSLTA